MTNPNTLRICVLGNAWSPHIQNRTRFLAERGHDVTLLSADIADIPGVRVCRIFPRLRFPFCGWSVLFSYLDTIRDLDPDVLHVHYASGFHAWVTLLLPKYPALVSLMGKDILFDEQGNPTVASKRLTLDTLEHAAMITSKSEHISNYLDTIAPSLLGKTELVRWGVNAHCFRPLDASGLKARLEIPTDAPVVLCPRGFGPVYNIDVLLRAFHLLRKMGNESRLVLFSFRQDTEYRKHMDSIIKSLDLEQCVIFVNDVSNTDMVHYYNLADVIVSIPSSDGMPQSLFEALSCESAVIVSDLPHYKELVRDGHEVIVTPIDEHAVAQAIHSLLNDAQLRIRLGKAGRAMVLQKADFDKDAGRVEEMLSKCSTQHNHRKPYSTLRMAGLLCMHYAEALLTGKER